VQTGSAAGSPGQASATDEQHGITAPMRGVQKEVWELVMERKWGARRVYTILKDHHGSIDTRQVSGIGPGSQIFYFQTTPPSWAREPY